jgi:hypothetical protein
LTRCSCTPRAFGQRRWSQAGSRRWDRSDVVVLLTLEL